MKYQWTEHYLKIGDGDWKAVTREEWIKAERNAGFRPKMSSDHPDYMTTYATAGFGSTLSGIKGKVGGKYEEIDENDTTVRENDMNRDIDKIRASILEHVISGIKINELIVKVFSDTFTQGMTINFRHNDIVETINQMITNGDIVEVEYVLPHLNYRIKSFLLPKGTEIISPNVAKTTQVNNDQV